MQLANASPEKGLYVGLRLDGRVRASGTGSPPFQRFVKELAPVTGLLFWTPKPAKLTALPDSHESPWCTSNACCGCHANITTAGAVLSSFTTQDEGFGQTPVRLLR